MLYRVDRYKEKKRSWGYLSVIPTKSLDQFYCRRKKTGIVWSKSWWARGRVLLCISDICQAFLNKKITRNPQCLPGRARRLVFLVARRSRAWWRSVTATGREWTTTSGRTWVSPPTTAVGGMPKSRSGLQIHKPNLLGVPAWNSPTTRTERSWATAGTGDSRPRLRPGEAHQVWWCNTPSGDGVCALQVHGVVQPAQNEHCQPKRYHLRGPGPGGQRQQQ